MSEDKFSTPPSEGNRIPSLQDEALDWIVRLRSGNATLQEHDDYLRWRAADGGHERAAKRAERLWEALGEVGVEDRRGRTRRDIIGGIVGVSLIGAFFALRPTGREEVSTSTAERRSIDLIDGSNVELNAATRLEIAFTERERRIVLRTGQALFSVAVDASRPFIVETPRGTVRALGTIFDINLSANADRISVVEGRVEVRSADRVGARLQAGEVASIRANAIVREPSDTATETSWLRGVLRFDNRPLGDVLNEIGRYLSRSILVTSRSVGDLPVTGVFPLDEPDRILDDLTATLPIRLHHLPFVTIVR